MDNENSDYFEILTYSFIAGKCCEVNIRVSSTGIYVGSCNVLFGTINQLPFERQKNIIIFTGFVMTYSIRMNKHYKQSNNQPYLVYIFATDG